MCCTTHSDRDLRDKARGIEIQYAEKKEFRCQCKYGLSCARRVTAEDMRCDWCREIDSKAPNGMSGHKLECEQQGARSLDWRRAAGVVIDEM